MAAAWHDIEQNMGSGINEDESAQMAGDRMRQHGFSETHIWIVKNLIKATKVEWTDGVMHQKAESMGRLEKIMADADLNSLWADTTIFVEMSLRLMAEIAKKPISQLTREELKKGWEGQVKFMTGRSPLSAEVTKMIGTQLQVNLNEAKKRVSSL
jgi:predicted metal-dependent HD superfamily phosphohydrolase